MTQLSQTDFQSLFESTPGSYLVLQPDFTIAAANDAYLKTTMTHRNEIIGRNLFEVFPDNPDDPDATGTSNLKASLNYVLQNKKAHTMAVQKYDIRRPDGSFEERFWSPFNKPVFNSEKEITWIIHRVEDVTDFIRLKQKESKQSELNKGLLKKVEEMEIEIYKRAQEIQERNRKLVNEIKEKQELELQIKKMNEQLEEQLNLKSSELVDIFERITDGFIALDKDFCYIYANKKIGEMIGREPQSLIGKNVWEIFPDAVGSSTYIAFNKAMKEQKYAKNEDYYPPLDLWQENNVYPSPQGLSVFIKDITEQKKYQSRLASERNLLRSLIDNLPVYIYVKDKASRYIITNKALVEIAGVISEEETIGKTVADLFDPEISDINFFEDQRIFDFGESVINREEAIQTKSGDKIWLLTSKVPLKDENNNITGLIGISRDITERKNFEILLEELNESLRKRAEELAASNTELERFAYVASHDLQEPLRMVSSFLELLEKRLGAQLDETGKKYMHFAVDGSDRMKKLIQDLLEYSRVGTNKENITNVDLNEIVESVRTILSLTIREKKAIIKTTQLPTLPAVKVQMQQLFLNLIGNALKYSGDRTPEIEIGCTEKEKTFLFFAKDNGIGIDPKFFEKIFVIFQRLHNRNEYSGTGIGLAICKKIVDRHNGKIWLESESGKGSTFFVEFPKKNI